MEVLILCAIFLLIATLYASAGFGGGSSYLAILSLYTLPFTDIRIVALCCNITVVFFSVLIFQSNGIIKWRKVMPIIILSVPLAFLGGRYTLEKEIYFIILGLTLLVASLLMLFSSPQTPRQLPRYSNAFVGGGIGFLSGLVGIGGGIFLSPLLYLSRWDKPKVIAATSSVFILVNSIAGLMGQLSQRENAIDFKMLIPLLLAVFVGGQIGTRMTINKLKPAQVKKVTALVIILVSLRLLWKYLL